MIVSCFLLSLLLMNHAAETFQQCSNILDLKPTNITASMDKADVFNNNYSNPEWVAMFKQDKAFCVIPRSGFYIQIDFKKIVTVSIIKVQGFILNQESFVMSAFSLEFSVDGKEWFEYHPKNGVRYLVAKFGKSNGDDVMSNKLDKPVATRFMRLMPQQRTKQSTSKNICLRMELRGCEYVIPPQVITPAKIHAVIPGNTTLSCMGFGTFGLALGWEKDSTKVAKNTNSASNVEETITRAIETKLSDLDKLKCQVHSQSMNCSKQFTCYGSYHFQDGVSAKSTTTMVIEVRFPSTPKSFQVKSKVKGSVTLSWQPPDFNDLTEDKLEYVFMCNHTNHSRELLPISATEKTITGLGIYRPYRCSLKVQLKNSSYSSFPFKFSQKPVALEFLSSTLRPNIKPAMKLQVHSPTEINITMSHVIFHKTEYGKISGFIVKAEILLYGPGKERRNPRAYFAKDLPMETEEKVHDHNPHQFILKGVIPWSKYKVSLIVFNNDGLKSNVTVGEIEMPEGVPSRGIELITFIRKKTALGVQTNFPIYYRNGEIVRYELTVNPGNKIKHIKASARSEHEIFEIMNLKPNTKYTLRCKASTKLGFGPFGPPLVVWTEEDVPSMPLKVHSLQAKHSDGVSAWYVAWETPDFPNGNITAYSVELELKNGTTMKFTTNQRSLHYQVKNTPKYLVKRINVRARTKIGWGPLSDSYYPIDEKANGESEKMSQLMILVVVVIGAVVFIFFLICLILYKRRTTRLCVKDPSAALFLKESTSSAHAEDEDDETNEINIWLRDRTDSIGTGSHSITNNTRDPIPVEEFAQYIESVKVDEYGTLRDEFNNISSGKCSPWQCAELPENRAKNRYTNINAYDHSRVILKSESQRKTSDYINANYIQGFNYSEDTGCYRYISAQGPLDNTRDDFWTMIWQQEVSIIVMVTNLVENDRVKCSQYWPNDREEYGDLCVTLDKIDKTADYVTRYFNCENKTTNEVRTVLQFHFVSWPDHGVPDYPTAILSLRRRIRHYYDPNKPMVVHCSAGVGRSGCFILIDAMLERIDQERSVDVYNFLCYMRSRRINMVQTFEQYRFAHTAMLEYITFGNTEIFVGELDKRIRQLGKKNGFAEEFELLTNNTTPVPSTGNPYQVLLREGKFIDAYHVDGYKQRDAFIITKAATKNNVGDFWKMVLEKQCHTIVMLNRSQEPTQEFFKYWPDVENHCVYKDTTVLTMSEVANGNIITRKIKVTTNKRKCEVYHFQYVDWPEADIPHRRGYTNICTLMQAVEKSQQNLGNGPIIVHGGNGYGRSGTFIAIYNSTERLKVEQLIDVLQCVRAIRISQPLAVDNITQYQFVYNMIRTYLEGFENYWNYKDYKVTRSPLNSSSTV